MHSHKCIKCKAQYQDKDPEPYLCEVCNQERLVIAKQIDTKVGSTVGQRPTGIAALEAEMKLKGGFSESPDGKHSKLFINIKDLGMI